MIHEEIKKEALRQFIQKGKYPACTYLSLHASQPIAASREQLNMWLHQEHRDLLVKSENLWQTLTAALQIVEITGTILEDNKKLIRQTLIDNKPKY